MFRLFALLGMFVVSSVSAEFNWEDIPHYRVNNGSPMKRCTVEAYKAGKCFEVAEQGNLIILAFELGDCKLKRPEDYGYVLLNTRSRLVTPLNITGEHCGKMPVPRFGESTDGEGETQPVISFFANNQQIQTFFLN
ncbi:hypothetical protein pEaSNUABM11_00207 [Erwinia phage pEa_SNUABM_11]|nr:hypothetical protein pEaSNUABM11_00207 [Erwinia phage pEa_SNUABM_11]